MVFGYIEIYSRNLHSINFPYKCYIKECINNHFPSKYDYLRNDNKIFEHHDLVEVAYMTLVMVALVVVVVALVVVGEVVVVVVVVVALVVVGEVVVMTDLDEIDDEYILHNFHNYNSFHGILVVHRS